MAAVRTSNWPFFTALLQLTGAALPLETSGSKYRSPPSSGLPSNVTVPVAGTFRIPGLQPAKMNAAKAARAIVPFARSGLSVLTMMRSHKNSEKQDSSVYQSLPRFFPSIGLQAFFHVWALMLDVTLRTLPSPRVTSITPCGGDVSFAVTVPGRDLVGRGDCPTRSRDSRIRRRRLVPVRAPCQPRHRRWSDSVRQYGRPLIIFGRYC